MNNDEIANRKIKEYLKNTIYMYDEFEQSFLRTLDMDAIRKYYDYIPDISKQILEEIENNEDKKEESSYEAFMYLLDKEFGIDKNIIEVGGGAVPTLGRKISLRQNKGSITIYDPRLTNYHKANDKFILKKELFHRNTDVTNADILIGFMPCEATQSIIENATDNNKDFMIAMCEGGPHGDEFDYYESIDEWLGSMLYLAERRIEEKEMDKLEVLSFEKYGHEYPLIYNKRKH